MNPIERTDISLSLLMTKTALMLAAHRLEQAPPSAEERAALAKALRESAVVIDGTYRKISTNPSL